MKIKVDQKIFSDFSGALIGVIIVKNLDNQGSNDEIQNKLRNSEKEINEKIDLSQITEHPSILPWREAYRKFGAKPKDYPSSIENLIRRVLKGEELRHINKLVDIYNHISLKYLLPVGGEDVYKIEGDIQLTYATENETPSLLLGEQEPRIPHLGEVIYKDDKGILCRRWNWKEADRTKLTEDTKNVILVIEALPPTTMDHLKSAVDELSQLVEKYCGGDFKSKILDSENTEFEF